MRIAAIILAAGSSQRMGRPKQVLPVGGRPMLRRVVDTVVAAGLSQVIVVLGASAGQIRPLLAREDVTIAINVGWREGIASSLRAGLAHTAADTDAALFVPGDMPRLTPDTLLRIAARFEESGAAIVLPTYRGRRGNPVLFSRSLFPELQALHGDRGGRMLFAAHQDDMAIVEVDDPGILIDIDTPEDYGGVVGIGC